MAPFRMTVSYDGRAYLGWQRHGEKPTVQYALEMAVTQVCGVRSAVHASGRTDRGAHARGQVVSIELPDSVDPQAVRQQLNQTLPADIRVIDVAKAPIGFDACTSAVGKRYRYVIWNSKTLPADRDGRVWHVKRQLDVRAMTVACALFEGEHDFASFATRPNFKQKSTVRNIFKLAMFEEQPLISIDIWADGFLYKMVRNIVRALVKAGEGRSSRDDIRSIIEARNRAAAPGTAPASGLYLERVFYSERELRDDLGRDFSG